MKEDSLQVHSIRDDSKYLFWYFEKELHVYRKEKSGLLGVSVYSAPPGASHSGGMSLWVSTPISKNRCL